MRADVQSAIQKLQALKRAFDMKGSNAVTMNRAIDVLIKIDADYHRRGEELANLRVERGDYSGF